MKILLFGATGSAGAAVLDACLGASVVDEIRAVTRRPLMHTSPKLRTFVHKDFLDYATVEDAFRSVDACLFCLGISVRQVSKEDYVKISHDYPVAAAKMLKTECPGASFHYISGAGTNAKSSMFWSKVKGQTENELMELVGANCWRPAYIDAKASPHDGAAGDGPRHAIPADDEPVAATGRKILAALIGPGTRIQGLLMTGPLHRAVHHLDPLLAHLFRLVPVIPGRVFLGSVALEETILGQIPRPIIDGPLGEHQVHMRLIDVVLGQRNMDRHRVGEPVAHQLARHIPCQFFALGWIQLARKGDLNFGVSAAIGAFVGVGGHPERVRVGLGELRHVAGFDQLDTPAPLVLAIARNVLRVRRRGRRFARRLEGDVHDGHAVVLAFAVAVVLAVAFVVAVALFLSRLCRDRDQFA